MVRLRMKKMGRKHRPYFRICAMDVRAPRDGRVLEELGVYDPLVPDVDARVSLDNERVAHWLSVGAQPSDKVGVFIKKYGPSGTRVEENRQARQKLLTERGRRHQIAMAAASQAAKAPAATQEEAEAPAEAEQPAEA